MKKVLWAVFPCTLCISLLAQDSRPSYAVAESGPNHRVWQRVTAETNAPGRVSYRTNSYTELATGVHYLEEGQRVESKPEIVTAADGAAAANGQPVVTSAPVYQVLPKGSNATFSVTMAQACSSYQWYRDLTLLTGATNTSLTLTSVQLTNNGSYKVVASSGAGTASPAARLVVLDAPAWVVWTNYNAHTNGKTMDLWTTNSHPIITNAPLLVWKTNSLLYGMTGFTAISPCNSFQGAQAPVTALTKRHGYTAGHLLTLPPYDGFGGHAGTKVWFCTASNQVIEMTVKIAYVRYTNGYDYTIFIFTEDLPATITPMPVMTPPGSIGVRFVTCQHGLMSANMPPFDFLEDTSRPPFNSHNTRVGGDSGSPNMIPMPEGSLVFIGGTTTSGPSVQMQKDMDFLCTNLTYHLNLNITNYQLNWYKYNP